jgi:NADH:ubiquinone oxidoreductase subunit 4 (subunit M)
MFFINYKIFNNINYYIFIIFSFLFFFRNNFFLLYFSFELIIIPILFIIIRSGTQIEKLKRRNYFIFYSYFFSIFFLIIIFKINLIYIIIYIKIKLNNIYLFLLLIIFLIKIPIYFFHFWLPKVHVEASTPARIILAGLLLKFGTFGINFFIKLINKNFLLLIFLIRFFGIIFSNFICIIQRDLKSFLAYSRIVHINFLIFNILILFKIRKFSSFIIIISHGFISTIIFLIIGEIYKYNSSRIFYFIKNIIFSNWKFLIFLILFFLFNRGIPINLSFFSEVKGILSIINYKIFFLFFIFLYFIYRFIYILFFLLNFYLGKNKLIIKEKNNINIICFLILSINFIIIIII